MSVSNLPPVSRSANTKRDASLAVGCEPDTSPVYKSSGDLIVLSALECFLTFQQEPFQCLSRICRRCQSLPIQDDIHPSPLDVNPTPLQFTRVVATSLS
jgi:hypothetical protein